MVFLPSIFITSIKFGLPAQQSGILGEARVQGGSYLLTLSDFGNLSTISRPTITRSIVPVQSRQKGVSQ